MLARSFGCVVAVVVCCSLLTAQEKKTHEPAPENLLSDPSLEGSELGPGVPEGWRPIFSQPDSAYRSQIVEGGRTGKRSLEIQGDGDFGVVAGNLVALDRKKRYAVRGWVKVEGEEAATAGIKFHYYDAEGVYIDQTIRGHVMPASKGWQFITVVDEADRVPKAKQIGLAVALTKKCKAQYDDLELLVFDGDKLPKNFELEYGTMPKVRVLQRRVGTWDVETTIRPCVWSPGGEKTTGVETIEWALGRQLLRISNVSSAGVDKSLAMMAYDPRTDTYASWFFDSSGFFPRTPTRGRWDEETQKFTFQGEADGIVSAFHVRLVENTRFEFEGLWTGKDGRVYLDMRGTGKRRDGTAVKR
jgi:hypothetical protein